MYDRNTVPAAAAAANQSRTTTFRRCIDKPVSYEVVVCASRRVTFWVCSNIFRYHKLYALSAIFYSAGLLSRIRAYISLVDRLSFRTGITKNRQVQYK